MNRITKSYWLAAALFIAVIAGGLATLAGEQSAGSSGSGDGLVTTEPYAPTLAAGRPSPEEAMANVAYVTAVRDAEVARFFAAVQAEEEAAAAAAAARAAAAKKAAAAAAPKSSGGSTANYASGDWGKWTPIVQCESGGNWAMNSGNGFTGGLQFMTSTWLAQGGGQYAPAAYLATPAQQIEIAERTLASGGWGQWPVCSRKAGYR